MNTLKKFWHSVKRNPVLNFFILTAIGQFTQDYLNHNIDVDHFAGYVATLLIGVIARMFTVPTNEHYDKVDAAYSKGFDDSESARVD